MFPGYGKKNIGSNSFFNDREGQGGGLSLAPDSDSILINNP